MHFHMQKKFQKFWPTISKKFFSKILNFQKFSKKILKFFFFRYHQVNFEFLGKLLHGFLKWSRMGFLPQCAMVSLVWDKCFKLKKLTRIEIVRNGNVLLLRICVYCLFHASDWSSNSVLTNQRHGISKKN